MSKHTLAPSPCTFKTVNVDTDAKVCCNWNLLEARVAWTVYQTFRLTWVPRFPVPCQCGKKGRLFVYSQKNRRPHAKKDPKTETQVSSLKTQDPASIHDASPPVSRLLGGGHGLCRRPGPRSGDPRIKKHGPKAPWIGSG